MYSDIADIYDEIFPLNRSFLKFIPDYLGEPGTKVLDLGCGPGDYVNELSSTYTVTGIDLNAEMIQLARKRNKGTFHQLSFTQIDRLGGDFSCIFCIGNSLSYLPTDVMAPFLKTVSELLSRSGYVVFQVVNWDKYRLTKAIDFDVKTLMDGRTFHREYEPAGNDTVLFKTELRSGGKVSRSWADPLYPKYMEDLADGLCAAGLAAIQQFGDFEKTPFNPSTSTASIIAAQKA